MSAVNSTPSSSTLLPTAAPAAPATVTTITQTVKQWLESNHLKHDPHGMKETRWTGEKLRDAGKLSNIWKNINNCHPQQVHVPLLTTDYIQVYVNDCDLDKPAIMVQAPSDLLKAKSKT